MISFLRQPYPVRDPRHSRVLFRAILSGALIAFILVVFQPFGSYNWHHPYKTLILAGYGLVAVVVNLLDFYLCKGIFRAFFAERNWTVWKEILRNMAGFVLAGFFCVVYGYLAGQMPFSLTQVMYMIVVCFMVGAFPATILILLNYAYLSNKYSTPATPATQTTPVATQAETRVELLADNGKDKLILPASDLLYIASSDNYCTVFHMENGKLTKTLLRSSLSRMQDQLSLPMFARCHRSFLVNLDKVGSVTGNAQGYKLYLDNMPEPIPVSRAYAPLVKEQFLAN